MIGASGLRTHTARGGAALAGPCGEGTLSEDFTGLGGLAAGARVAGYRLEAQVGAGGMAVVFRARDERLGRLVALKLLAPGLAADEEFRRRFTAESRAAAAVDHPHIIPVYEAGQAGGALFIAMRLVTGGDLRQVIAREGPLAPERAAGLLSPVASALDAAHRAGLVHRDVKPGNVLVDSDPGRPEHVYLSDFGISKGAASSAGLTGAGQFLGTPEYTSPEQARGLAVDGRADQYALACVAWHLLAGTVPFQRDQGHAVLLAHLTEPPPPLAGRRPDLPAAAGQVLARAMAKEPGERYPSCGEFTDALRQALALPPYRAAPELAAAGHPRTETSGQPVLPEPDAAAVGMAAASTGPADAHAAVEGSFPAAAGALGNRAGTVSGTGGLAAGPNKPAAFADRPTEDLVTAGRRIRSGPGPGGNAARPTRRRCFLAIALGCSVLTAAVVVPLVLGMPGAPRPLSRPLTGTLTATLADPASQGVFAVAFAPGGATLAVADGNGRTYLWDTTTGKITATLAQNALAVAFAPDGTTLAAGNMNGRTYLWRISRS
jgi:Protein kinase domain/WD domain, G-beta repeat